MNIQEYIKKHALDFWHKHPPGLNEPWTPEFLLESVKDMEPPERCEYEIFANKDRTHFVSINKTRAMFRVSLRETILLQSEWHPMHLDFVLSPVR